MGNVRGTAVPDLPSGAAVPSGAPDLDRAGTGPGRNGAINGGVNGVDGGPYQTGRATVGGNHQAGGATTHWIRSSEA